MNSKIVLQSVQFKASAHLESYVDEKVSKLLDQDNSIINAKVSLFEDASGKPKNQYCEIELSVPGENLFVKKNSDSYEQSVLETVAALQKILRRRKTKKILKRKVV